MTLISTVYENIHKAQETQIRMNRLAGFSNDVLKIVVVLQEMAAQTKLLSLNTAIEAARAGEHGLGFGVVDKEVETLIYNFTKEIQELAQETKDGVIETEKGKGKQKVEVARSSFQNIRITVHELKDNNDDLHGKAEEMNRVSENIEKISRPISENRRYISAGLYAALELIENNSDHR